MLSFFDKIEDNTHFHLEKLEIGWSNEEMGFMAALNFDIASLPRLLSSIGFDLPEGHTLTTNHVSIVLAYERTKGNPDQKGYASFAKITIAGPLKLNDIIDTGQFTGLPALERVELVFEIDASTADEKEKKQSAKDTLIGFKMYFSTEGRKDTTIIEAVYEKVTKSEPKKLSAGNDDTTKETINKTFRAAMYSPEGGDSVHLDFHPFVPIVLNIKDLFILQTSETENTKITSETTLFGIDLDFQADLDLSKLPVVGKDLADTKLSFESFRLLYSRNDIKQDSLKTVNHLLDVMGVKPEVAVQKSEKEKGSETSIGLKKGFNFHGTVRLGDDKIELFSGSKAEGKGDKLTSEADEKEKAAQTEKPAQVGKKYGPVTIQSMSMGLKKGFHLDLTGSLALGPLELDLMGFSLDFPIDKLLPHHKTNQDKADDSGIKMSIQGLNLQYNKPPLIIDGGFLKEADETKGVKYSGALAIGLKAFQLVAFGSYGEEITDTDKFKTFFIYGFLATPPLGPPFLQLTGVALGFGYNRLLQLPAPADIDQHPLVSPVLSGTPPDFKYMNEVIAPSKGDYWAAVGVRIESFKMINAFVLAIFKFGHEFEIDLLGRVSLVLPKNPSGAANIPALAKLEIGIVATILPERGVVEINGSILTGSYIFEPSAMLSGGFAVLVLAKDQSEGKWAGGKAGDFVISFGGYSPSYTPKPYYPQSIPRMALAWKPYDRLDVSAEMYFAVLPEAFMFGGHLSANFDLGGKFSIFVHFTAGFDFIVWWQPKRYIGHAYANLNVRATIHFIIWKTVEFDISGDITFWGPPFAGHASFKVHVLVTFTVGIDFGPAQNTPQPISWDNFKQTLLPEEDKVVSAALTNGLLGKIETAEKKTIYLVNPKDLELDISSAFPVKNINGKADSIMQAFGIAPMAINDFGSDLNITFTKGDGQPFDFSEHFTVERTTKNYPASVWQNVPSKGTIPPPPPQAQNLMELCGGVVLKAKEPKKEDPFTHPSTEFDTISIPAASWTTGEFFYAS